MARFIFEGTVLQNKLLPIALIALSQSVAAQQPPTAGSQIQQIPPAPVLPKAAPETRVEQDKQPAVAEAADQVQVIVNSLQVTGARTFPDASLLAVTGFNPGSKLTLAELRGMAAKIADYYHKRGYFLAQAYLPAQDIKDGVVTVAVIEGQFGKVTLHNQANLSDRLANSLLEGVNGGDAVTVGALESRLLLLSDIPGVKVKSTLVPGASVGTSDLIVDVTPGQRLSGSIDADNQGSRYTGQNRVGATVNLNNPFGQGDVASVRAMTSADGLNYGRASYQAQICRAKAGIAYSSMDYRLGEEFESLQAHGTAHIASLYGSYPLIRSRSNNLYVQLAFDDKSFHDKQDSTSTVTDKKAQVWMASLNGDHRDTLGGGGLSSYGLVWSVGNIDIRSPAALDADEVVHSNGQYGKLGFNASRLQSVTGSISLYAGVSGQFASKNLDISEKMGLGGAYAVRAYPGGEAFGDQGYVLNLEARSTLPRFFERLPGQLQLIGFVDTGTVILNKNAFAAGPNRRTLSGAGVGVAWADNDNFVIKAYYAHKLGNAVATSAPDSMGRFWIQGVKFF
jgi:hemolysin activation/secretion protein